MTATTDTNYHQVGYKSKTTLTQTISAARKIISDAAATHTLTHEESGSMCLFDRAAGVVYTLPEITAATIGMFFDFRTVVTITSNAAKVITANSAQFILGDVQIILVAAKPP